MRKFLLVSALLTAVLTASAQSPDQVIPKPNGITLTGGVYTFEDEPKVECRVLGMRSHLPAFPEGGYEMTITKRGVKILASDEAGFFYARQTLDQMTRWGKVNELQCCRILDIPRFPYRGLHVDVSRHFRSIDFL